MNAQIATTGVSRMDHKTRTGKAAMSNARAFLAKVQLDDDLAEKMAEADGDMTRIVALAEGAGHACSARDLLAAYEDLLAEPDASVQGAADPAASEGLRTPSGFGYPIVYLTLASPSDYGYPIVYLAKQAS